jgi:GNAT superfamily N-acetyltransferase
LPADLAKKYPKNLHVPCWILGRLAVDKRFQRKGLGEKLLMAAFSKVLDITQDAGGYCLIVDVKNNDVRNFYRKYGFLEFAGNSSRFYLPLASIPV